MAFDPARCIRKVIDQELPFSWTTIRRRWRWFCSVSSETWIGQHPQRQSGSSRSCPMKRSSVSAIVYAFWIRWDKNWISSSPIRKDQGTDQMYKPIPFFMSSRGYGMFMHTSAPWPAMSKRNPITMWTDFTWATKLWFLHLLWWTERDPEWIYESRGKSSHVAALVVREPGWGRISYFQPEQKDIRWQTNCVRTRFRLMWSISIPVGSRPTGNAITVLLLIVSPIRRRCSPISKKGASAFACGSFLFPPKTNISMNWSKGLYAKERRRTAPGFRMKMSCWISQSRDHWNGIRTRSGIWFVWAWALSRRTLAKGAPYNGIYTSANPDCMEHNLYPLRYNKAVADIIHRGTWREHYLGKKCLGRFAALSFALGWRCRNDRQRIGWNHPRRTFLRLERFRILEPWHGRLCHHDTGESLSPLASRSVSWLHIHALTVPLNRALVIQWEFCIKAFRLLRWNEIQADAFVYAEAKNCTETGLPMVRALFVEFPHDPGAWLVEDEYLFEARCWLPHCLKMATDATSIFPEENGSIIKAGKSMLPDGIIFRPARFRLSSSCVTDLSCRISNWRNAPIRWIKRLSLKVYASDATEADGSHLSSFRQSASFGEGQREESQFVCSGLENKVKLRLSE